MKILRYQRSPTARVFTLHLHIFNIWMGQTDFDGIESHQTQKK